MKRVILILTLSTIFLGFLACVANKDSALQSSLSPKETSALIGATSVKEAWKEKWARILEGARREGSVVDVL